MAAESQSITDPTPGTFVLTLVSQFFQPSRVPSQVNQSAEDNTAQLVERARQGDSAAFGTLTARYRTRILALAFHLTGSRSDAEDITQDVFLRAYKQLAHFEGRSEFFTWIYRIAVNRSLNAIRDGKVRRASSLDDPRVEVAVTVDAYGDPRKAAELRQTYARLVQALDALSESLRTTVVLVALQSLSHEEAGLVLGCPPGTIAWRMHEARKRLTVALEDPAESTEPVRAGTETTQTAGEKREASAKGSQKRTARLLLAPT